MGYIAIIRPLNCIITFVSVLCGAWVGKEIIFTGKIVFAGLVGFLVCAYGNIINDLNDIEIDRINNPKRPLVTGLVKNNIAVIMAILFAIISLAITAVLGLKPFLLVLITIILLSLYALYLKKMVFSNFTVAIIAGLSFAFGGFITENIISLIPALFAILIHTPREIIKDIMDIKGDRAFNVASLPIIYGEKKARNIACFFLILLIIACPLPFVFGVFNIKYLMIIGVIAIPLIIFTIAKLHNSYLASNLLKFIMFIGLIAFIIG
ncbi:MAG: geranylgeranylglycerol-phosphate geranylgeranyltransferase [bacterium]